MDSEIKTYTLSSAEESIIDKLSTPNNNVFAHRILLPL